jgi:MoxR-like ATPase
MALIVDIDGQLFDFKMIRDPLQFETPGFTKAIYKADIKALWEQRVEGQIQDEKGNPVTVKFKLYQWSLFRLLKLQVALSQYFVGYDEIIRVLLACAIAQEPVLFIGKPGVAKTEVALSFFSAIGLRKQQNGGKTGRKPGAEDRNKYFEYLLSPFTVPEELFGTLNFRELERGTVTRINTNMATGKLVRGIFLDEIFNASSNILNTLLGLINERRYFDRGMFQDADLKLFIGASNSTPISKSGAAEGLVGNLSSDLEAFYDRFTIRLYFPTPQEKHVDLRAVMEEYERIDKISSSRFMEKLTLEKPESFPQIACINDILLLGRILGRVNFPESVKQAKNTIVASLSMQRSGRALSHISPRKPNKLMPIILADTFLLDTKKNGADLSNRKIIELIGGDFREVQVTRENLKVFHHIWDYEGDREELAKEVDLLLEIE